MNKLFLIIIFICTSLFAQKNYFVNKNGNADFKSIKEVNEASLSPGDIVSFKSGQQFSDAVLNCKTGVTYNTYDGSLKAILGDSTSSSFSKTVYIPNDKVSLINLKLEGYSDANFVVLYKSQYMTIENCIIVGGKNAHSVKTIGIGEEDYSAAYNYGHKITQNIIHDLATGINLSRPRNYEISYNTMFDFWREDGKMDHGGRAIARTSISEEGNSYETFDSEYTFHIHHNEIYNFEYVALHVGYSRMLVEYNEFHSPLDERIYRGGVKHGSIGKIYDKTAKKLGALGMIFRYNYIHDFIRKGEAGYTYGEQTPAKVRAKTYDVVSTNNGLEKAVYEGSGSLSYVPHFGDDTGEGPDNLISGLGYGNFWIHNNIIYNITNKISGRSFTRTVDYNSGAIDVFREDLPTYFVNNTLLNVGTGYVAQDHLIVTESTSQSPHIMVNNIIDYNNPSARSVGRYKEKDLKLANNIYLRQEGTTKGASADVPRTNSQIATFFQGEGQEYTLVQKEYHKTDPNWVDSSSMVFAPNIGPNGVWIPDVRIKEGGNAHNTGMNYDLIGDDYTVLDQTHQLGKDPTGRSFAYDILGNFRTTNDIGAVGSAAVGQSVDTSTPAKAPIIVTHPSNQSVNEGSTASFSVTATCDDEIGYQWWKSPFISDSESKIVNNEKFSGAGTSTLIIKNVTAEDAAVNYLCEVYNTKDHSSLWINSNSASIIISQSSIGTESSSLKVFLEAPFVDGKMTTVINSSNLFPSNHPYQNEPWKLNISDEISEIKSNYVDWLLIELRKESNQVIYSKPGILTEDGIILNSDGSKLSFSNINEGEYYIAVKHRNHLGIMSTIKIIVKNREPILYDFTTSKSSAYGNNAMTDLGNGIYGMYAGDSDANGIINNLDFGNVANNIPLKGYNNNDLDMNGSVNVLDYNKINKNILKSSQIH